MKKAFALFAILGVIGLGTCGFGANNDNASLLGFVLIVVSLIGLFVTVVSMAIKSIAKATEKATRKK